MSSDFVGAGWAFPLRTGPTGGIALVRGDREVVESIWLILSTAPGERPGRPEFGCAIHELVFAPADPSTAGQIAYQVRRALDRWEPRIELDDVLVDFADAARGELLIDIRYRLRHDNDPRNLVFPFYTIPAHDPGAD
ncbi:GPW/gp25 family protein [Micromonospora sp. CPCC 206060]|uniref:GPW/gp25 family protein n=1 Tax=Micromonospora sp. CPCC 206060 TaxID=3122406 RepID=UPI002FF3BB5C